MAVRDGRGDVKQTTTGFRGPLMVQSLTSAKSKFLSLTQTWTTAHGASETGAFWSLERPAGAGATSIDSAVLPVWGNSMTHMTAVKLPAGTVIHVGEVGAQGGYFVGGGKSASGRRRNQDGSPVRRKGG